MCLSEVTKCISLERETQRQYTVSGRNGQFATFEPRVLCRLCSDHESSDFAGFYKRGCQEKTLFPIPRRFFSGIQPLSATARLGTGAWNRLRDIFGCVVPCELFAPASSVLAKGQPWFYLRLATKRGTIALLGCPREHTVPRETLRLNPPWILTLEPERSATAGLRNPSQRWLRVPQTLRAQAACNFRCSALNVSPFFQIFRVMAAILRASVRRAISGRMPLSSNPR
jgi:hypothetical protein